GDGPSAERYFTFTCVRFFRATRGKTAHKKMTKYHAAAGKKRWSEMLHSRNCVSLEGASTYDLRTRSGWRQRHTPLAAQPQPPAEAILGYQRRANHAARNGRPDAAADPTRPRIYRTGPDYADLVAAQLPDVPRENIL